MTDRFLAVENATVIYGRGSAACRALSNLTVAFEQGRLTLVVGPSGSGKTTLLSLLGCLLTPDEGSVYIHGMEVSALREAQRAEIRRRNIGFVFQAFRLFKSLSALENTSIGAEIAGQPHSGDMAEKLLEGFGLKHKLHLKPDALSGGEKQRVAIARALVRNPSILLADEPTASLDSRAGLQICEILLSLAEEQKRTVVVVSHDGRWKDYAHQVLQLRDGRLAQPEV